MAAQWRPQVEKAGVLAAGRTGPGSGAEGLFGALVRQQTRGGAGFTLARPDAEQAAKTETGGTGSVGTVDEGSRPSAVPAQVKASFSDALQLQAGEIGEKSRPAVTPALLTSGSAPSVLPGDGSAPRSDGSGFKTTPEKVGEQLRAAAEVPGRSDGTIQTPAKDGMGRKSGTAEFDPGRRELQLSAGIRTAVSTTPREPMGNGMGDLRVRDGLGAPAHDGMEKDPKAEVGGSSEASSGVDAKVGSDLARGVPELLGGAMHAVLSGGEVPQPGLPVPKQSESVASLPGRGSEPGSARKEGATQPSGAGHHEKKSELHSTGKEPIGRVALSIQPEGTVGLNSGMGTQAYAGIGMVPGPEAPLHPVVPAPGRITTGADLRGFPTRTAPSAGKKKIVPSPGEPVASKSGDLAIEPAPLSHLVSGEPSVRGGGSGGHAAGAISETLRPVQLRTEVVAATTVPPKNPGAEVSGFGLQAAVQPVHAVHGAAAAPPQAAVAPTVHPTASATFERMDAAEAPQVLESAPHRLAVGVQSGGLGWVEIHTISTAGQVSATVASGSAESHSAIAAQLPTVREFLAGEHVRIDHLGSERFSSSSGGEGGSQGRPSGRESGQSSRSMEPQTPAPASLQEPEWERLSYISVRV